MIAKLIYYCPKCDSFFSQPGNCPGCQSELETKAAINAYELKHLIEKLSTPEGIVKIMTGLKAYLEGPAP